MYSAIEGKPQTVQDVTLLVTPDQAQRVALATGDGRIQLALRNPMDKKAAEPLLVVRSSLYEGPTMENPAGGLAIAPEKPVVKRADGLKKPAKPAASTPPKKKEPIMTPLPQPPPQRIVVVELIQGIKRTKDTFQETNSESTGNSTQPDGIKK